MLQSVIISLFYAPIVLLINTQSPSSSDVSVTTSTWLHTFKIPESFSRATMEAMERGVIKKGARTDIINMVAFKVFEHTSRPTSEEYTTVCRMLIVKHPVLKDKVGNGYVSSHILYSSITYFIWQTSLLCLTCCTFNSPSLKVEAEIEKNR